MNAVLRAPAVTLSTASPTSLIHDDSGQGLAEYGLVLAFIAVLCAGTVLFFGGEVEGMLNNIGASF